ncbi:MFS transporter [Treponema pedis]|uniref:MFS transporter n=1 Tax=Treponema pedis TaxID=409322 RepID=UPI0030B8CCA9
MIIKRIGEKSNLVKLNTFLVLLANASLLIGQYLGGYCFTKKGISEILIINAISFLISGLINQFLYKEYCTAVDKMQGSVFKDLYTAIKAVIKNKTAIILIITILLINIHSAVSGFSVFFLFSEINNSIFTPDAYTGFIMAGTVGNIIGLSITVTTGDNIFKIKHIPLLLIFIFLCTIFHFSFGNIIYVCIINCLIFIALGLMNSLLEAYIMHTIDENFLGQYYTVSANIKLLLSPAITYALGCLLRTVSAVYVYTGSAALLIGPILYIVFNVKKLKI